VASQRKPGLRVLLLEDDIGDLASLTQALEEAHPDCRLLRVDTRNAFERALDGFAPDVILSNPGVAEFTALQALRLTQNRLPGCPFLLVARAFGQMSSDCLRAGAADFIRTAEMSRLAPSIAAAIRLRAPLRKLSKRQRQVLQLIVAGYSTREIAARLRLSAKTVEAHRTEMMSRLGIRGIAGLVGYAIRAGFTSTVANGELRGPRSRHVATPPE
jgi:DNA-binding NarL/FixJ family response regulator